MERIVLDTNCLIQSISPRSPYRRIWDSFFDGTNLLCVTTSILNEYEEILNLLTNEETAKYIIDAIVSNLIIALKQYRLYHSNDTTLLAWLQVSFFTW